MCVISVTELTLVAVGSIRVAVVLFAFARLYPHNAPSFQVKPVQEQALSTTYRIWRELRHHLERSCGVKVEECPVCHGGDCVHSAHADGNLKLDVVDLSQNNYASRYEDLPGSLAVPIRHVVGGASAWVLPCLFVWLHRTTGSLLCAFGGVKPGISAAYCLMTLRPYVPASA